MSTQNILHIPTYNRCYYYATVSKRIIPDNYSIFSCIANHLLNAINPSCFIYLLEIMCILGESINGKSCLPMFNVRFVSFRSCATMTTCLCIFQNRFNIHNIEHNAIGSHRHCRAIITIIVIIGICQWHPTFERLQKRCCCLT